MTAAKSGPNVSQLVLVPAIVSFAVTILRLVGELNNWSPLLFSRDPGGGGAIIGISWLVPVFGVYFAIKLVRDGFTPTGNLKVVVFAVVGAVASMVIFMPGLTAGSASVLSVTTVIAGSAVGVLLQRIAWPELFKTLIAYAFAVRIPVAIIMLVAIFGDWGTHYDVTTQESIAAMSPIAKWFFIGAVPQFTFWIMFTVVIGSLSGGIAAIVMRAKAPEEATQAT